MVFLTFSWVQWGPEIAFHNPLTPALVIGTKSDLRDDPIIIDILRNQ